MSRSFYIPFALIVLLVASGCGEKDTLRIYAHQSNSEPAFGSRVSLYPTEQDYHEQTTPVLTGTCNQEDESNGWAFFESFDLYNGQFYFDIVFQDSIGNWAVSGAENQFTGSADGGENITVGGAQLGLNYHNFLLGTGGSTDWVFDRATDTQGNVINQLPACLEDQDRFTVNKDLSLTIDYGAVQCAFPEQYDTLAINHQGDHLLLENFYGASSAVSVFIDAANDELYFEDGVLVLHFRRD